MYLSDPDQFLSIYFLGLTPLMSIVMVSSNAAITAVHRIGILAFWMWYTYKVLYWFCVQHGINM